MITEIELAYHAEGWGSGDFVAALRQVGLAGFSGMEVAPSVVESFGDRVHVFREMLDDVGLRLAAVESVLPPLTEENVEDSRDRLLGLSAFTGPMGVDVILVRPPYRLKRDTDGGEWKLFTGLLSDVGKQLGEKGVKLCVRPAIDTIIEKRTEIDALMDATPKNAVKLCPDTSHMLVVKIAPATLFNQYADRIGYVRVADGLPRKQLKSTWRRREPAYRAVGKGKIQLKQIIKALDKAGYEGWLCASHPPPAPRPDAACRSAMDAIEKALDVLV